MQYSMRQVSENSRFQHDCDACEFLGHTLNVDLYVCDKTLIVRHGHDGPDYYSITVDGNHHVLDIVSRCTEFALAYGLAVSSGKIAA